MPNQDIHILQFGTGNFLRAFFEPMVQTLNKKNIPLNICMIQSTGGKTLDKLKAQNFHYHVCEAGIKNGEKVQEIQKITCVREGLDLPKDNEKFLDLASNPQVKWIISNVTEAGMVWKEEGLLEEFAESFAGRIAQWLIRRFERLSETETVLLPCELIPNNGDLLKEFVVKHARRWNQSPEFFSWLDRKVYFFNNLVDRIVPGFPNRLDLKEKENDALVVQTEPYSFWAIEGKKEQSPLLPFLKADSQVVLEEDIQGFSLRKIRILNGCHTYIAAKGIMTGYQTVREFISDKKNLSILNEMVEKEIIPYLGMDLNELKSYKEEIFARFANPFVDHRLEDILLNSTAKFKSRLLPLFLPFSQKNEGIYPKEICKGLIYLLHFYLQNPNQVRETSAVTSLLAEVPRELSSKEKIMWVTKNLFGLKWNPGLEQAFLDITSVNLAFIQNPNRQHI
ncbi:tagaturonate reductase [Algoriphagus confluentis]|uniref:Tagaturonate reductase n=2 Tax=Algoriphagus confluentis TaxID=1697556 RepID=A0ABQ6PI71_9BACT|nr:tagaturonate reductase [Algoriphagus confluentis]